MAPVVRVKFLGEKGDFDRAADDVEQRSGHLGGVLGGMGGAAKLGMLGAAGAAVGLGVGLASTIEPASHLNETISFLGVQFGESSRQLMGWGRAAADTMGMSRQEALDSASTFGTMGKAAGLTGDELVQFAKANTGLAADMASAKDVKAEEAIEAYGAALRGEMEPIRRFGVLIDDAALRTKALEMGLVSNTTDALTPQNKALAANALVWEQTKDMQGDFQRTQGGLSGQTKTLTAEFQNMKVQIGSALVPILLTAIKAFRGMMPVIKELAGGITAFFNAFADGGDEITSAGLAGKLEGFGVIARNVADRVAQYWPQIQAVATQVFGAVGAVIGVLVQTVQANWPQIQSIIATVVDVVGQRIRTLVEVFQGVVTWLQVNWPQIRAIVEPVITALVETVGAALGLFFTVQSTVLGLIMAAWRKWGDEIMAVVLWVAQTLGPIIEGALAVVTGIFDFFASLLQGKWGQAWDALVGIFQGVWDVFVGVLRGAIDGLRHVIGALFGIGEALIGKLWEGMGRGWEALWGWLTSIPGAIWRAIEGAGPGLRNVGWNIIMGLWNGFGDAWNRFIGWVGEQIDRLPWVFKKVLGIASPSKVMFGLGQNVAQGLQLGISSGMPGASAALAGLAMPDLGSMAAAGSGLAGQGGVYVGGVLVTERDLVTVVVDGARRFTRERS